MISRGEEMKGKGLGKRNLVTKSIIKSIRHQQRGRAVEIIDGLMETMGQVLSW